MTIINRIFNYRFILFSIYHLLSLQLLNCVIHVSCIIKLLLDWIGLDWLSIIIVVVVVVK